MALKKWADEQSDIVPSASTSEIARHLEFLAATLPSRGVDVETAKMRFAVYSRFLGDFSNDALAYMARRVCEEYDWFPTPRQCLEILREYRPPVSNKEIALSYCHTFWQARFEEFISALDGGLVTPDMLADQPERWKLIAAERGYLRRMDDGSFIIRVRKEPMPFAEAAE